MLLNIPILLITNFIYVVDTVNANWEINWEIVREYQHIEKILPSTPFHVRNSDYELALVTPSYRGSPSIYVVTQVCDDLTPESCFPTEDFDSYTHYYKERHGIAIWNLKQPLLEVKPISSKINCIKPRYSMQLLKYALYRHMYTYIYIYVCIHVSDILGIKKEKIQDLQSRYYSLHGINSKHGSRNQPFRVINTFRFWQWLKWFIEMIFFFDLSLLSTFYSV